MSWNLPVWLPSCVHLTVDKVYERFGQQKMLSNGHRESSFGLDKRLLSVRNGLKHTGSLTFRGASIYNIIILVAQTHPLHKAILLWSSIVDWIVLSVYCWGVKVDVESYYWGQQVNLKINGRGYGGHIHYNIISYYQFRDFPLPTSNLIIFRLRF